MKPSVRGRLRLMASGIDISDKLPHVVQGMVRAQLDFQLIEYYKLLVQLHIENKNFETANEILNKLFGLITMTEAPAAESKQDELNRALENMDNWIVEIDPTSLTLPKDKLMLKSQIRGAAKNLIKDLVSK